MTSLVAWTVSLQDDKSDENRDVNFGEDRFLQNDKSDDNHDVDRVCRNDKIDQ